MIAFFKDKIRNIDPVLFVCTSVLSLISLVVLFGARDSDYGSMRNFIMQLAMTVLGLVFMVVLANIDFSDMPKWFYWAVFGFSCALLIFLVLNGERAGEDSTTNKNWINIPIVNIYVQPSEFIRATFILTFAKHLSAIKEDINNPKKLLPLALHAGAILVLLLLSGDLGMTLVYCGIIAVMLYCAGLSLWYFAAVAVILVLMFPLLWDFLAEYQQERILFGFNPDLDPTNVGAQQISSRAAIAGGGFFGRGISGAGSYKNMYACLTDFFFATYSEMFGFLGCLVLLAIITTVVVRLIILGKRSQTEFGSLLCAGVAGMLIVQTVENIGMCLCLLPVVGITLPFLSYGGSSVLSIYLIFGFIHGSSTQKKKI